MAAAIGSRIERLEGLAMNVKRVGRCLQVRGPASASEGDITAFLASVGIIPAASDRVIYRAVVGTAKDAASHPLALYGASAAQHEINHGKSIEQPH